MPFNPWSLLKRAAAPADAAARLPDAIALHREGRLQEAAAICEKILEADPGHAECLNLLGILAAQAGDARRAVELMGRAIVREPRNASYLFNHGLALKHVGRLEEAIASYSRALEMDPGAAAAYSNRGLAFKQIGDLDSALADLERAVAIRPGSAEAQYNFGLVLHSCGRVHEALEAYDRAITAYPQLAEAHYNRAIALRDLKQLEPALRAFEAAHALKPHAEFLAGNLLLARMHLNYWEGFGEQVATIEDAIERGQPAAPPFVTLAAIDSPRLQRKAAEIYVRARFPADAALGPLAPSRAGGRIRIGYFSADFREHPVAHLAAGLFESHDRSGFETVGFSLGPVIADGMRARLECAFDRFVDASDMTDREVARRAREMGIDIAVDLGGHTHSSRAGIFALRCAPVQVGYLGYLGTSGAPYMDYLFADDVLVPEDAARHYVERIAWLPHYQVNDTKRVMAEPGPTREEAGLPAHAFVFCCLSNSYKITPATFDSWMRILARVPESVLVLHAPCEAEANLRREAGRRGIDAGRLRFVGRLPHGAYLARFRVMDLFLDTHPYNAGTVAADALWAGLPMVTLCGNTFASRVGASVLRAVGLPDLVADNVEAYESLAVALATRPERIAAAKEFLRERSRSQALFDIGSRTRDIESAYRAMHARAIAGLAPDHIRASPGTAR